MIRLIKNYGILVIITGFIIQANNSTIENIKLADSFFDENLYDLALIEYKRINTNYPDNNYHDQVAIKIAKCYEKMGYFEEAIKQYELLIENNNNFIYIFHISRIYHFTQSYRESNNFIKYNLDNYDVEKVDTLFYIMACNYFALNEIDSSKIFFEKIINPSLLSFAKKSVNHINNFQNEKLKDPMLARRLNFIFPGLGYLYLNMPQTFTSAFIIESMFLYATYSSNKNGYTSGTLIGALFFSGFYFGSTHGAWSYAIKNNKKIIKTYLSNINYIFL